MHFLDFFSGIGGFRLGMEIAGHECIGHCEIDKFANRSYIAMHGPREDEWFETDITKVKAWELPRADVWCFGFPCQDISVAGKQRGLNGARSGLFFTVIDLIKGAKEEDRPSILIIENVKNLLSINGGWDFANVLISLDEAGYDAEWQVLNSKDYGVPQNRERVYIIGHLRGRGTRKIFPFTGNNSKVIKKFQGDLNGKGYCSIQDRVYFKDGLSPCLTGKSEGIKLLEQHPISIGYKSQKKYIDIAHCLCARDYKGVSNQPCNAVEIRAVLTPDRINKRQNGRRFKEDGEPMFTLTTQDIHGVAILRTVRNEYGKTVRKQYESGEIKECRCNLTQLEPRTDGISNTLTTVQKDNLLLISEATKQGYAVVKEGDSVNLAFPNSSTRRGRVGKQLAQTLDTKCNQGTLVQGKIRKLTPKECFRLQGFPDQYFERARAVNSDSQLYKQAGNCVSVPVIYAIAINLELLV